MKRKGILFFMVLVCGAGLLCAADGPGTGGFVVLRQNAGPRPASMGDAFVAVADDINALQYNPAGLVQVRKFELAGMFFRNISRMDTECVGLSVPLGKTGIALPDDIRGTVGISIVEFDAGNIVIEHLDGTSEDYQAQHDYVGTLGFAFGNDFFGFGISCKYVDSLLLGTYYASAIAFDVGGIVDMKVIKLGASILNLGFDAGYDADYSDPLPLISRAGVSTKFNLQNVIEVAIDVRPTVEIVRSIDFPMQVRGGVEVTTAPIREGSTDVLFARAGYAMTLENRLGHLSYGVGARLDTVQFDVCLARTGDIGPNGRISMIIRF